MVNKKNKVMNKRNWRSKVLVMFLFVSIFVVSFSGGVLAQPSISSVSGDVSDGGSVSVSGSEFGTNLLDIEWLGGADGNIEQGVDGNDFAKSEWSADSDSAAFYSPRYSTTISHSGSKSIVSQYPLESNYGSGFSYDYGSEFGEIYATWWVNFDHVDSGGQWKQWRLSPTSSWNNADGELERGDFYSTAGDCSQALIFIFCNLGNLAGDYSPCFPDSNIGLRWTSCQPRDAWYRIELYAKESSSIGTRDGTLIYRIHNQSSTVSTPQNWIGTIITRDTGVPDRWRYMQFQNYWGNIVGDGTQEKIYIDDIYMQVGSRARIEIGDNTDWDLCTHREIQIPTLWADGSITFTVNQGSFLDGDSAYLFVVDENGTASAGYPITFTSVINDTTPPTRSSPSPTGNLSSGATNTTISLTTDEDAICRYSISPGIDYSLMAETFDNTDSTSHSGLISGLTDGQTYNFYVRCNDTSGNFNTDDFLISFGVDEVSTTCGPADTDFDSIVSITEIMAYITEWKAGNVNIVDLMAGITEWKNGCS